MTRPIWIAGLFAGLAMPACSPRHSSDQNPATGAPAGLPGRLPASLVMAKPDSNSWAACRTAREYLGDRVGAVIAQDSAADLSTAYPQGAGRLSCQVVARGHAAQPNLVLDSLVAHFRGAGWGSALVFDADGPDGSTVGLHSAGTTCILHAGWDGGDDTDSTYVPADTLLLQVDCAPTAPGDTL
jgi:hypothetical protein